jgi:hypothetical protein
MSERPKQKGFLAQRKYEYEEGISSVVEAAFARARQATSQDGQSYYVLGELTDSLNEAIDSFVGGLDAIQQRHL